MTPTPDPAPRCSYCGGQGWYAVPCPHPGLDVGPYAIGHIDGAHNHNADPVCSICDWHSIDEDEEYLSPDFVSKMAALSDALDGAATPPAPDAP